MTKGDPQPPRIPPARQLIPKSDISPEDDQVIEHASFVIDIHESEIKRLSCVECIFTRSTFTETKIFQPHLRDCRLEHVDLSNADWPESNFARVEIIDSKLTGWKINESILSDVVIKESKGDYAQFQLLKTKRILFDHCDFTNTYFNESDLRHAVFKDCDLTRADFSKTCLQGADLRGSKIEGIRLDLHFLHGVKVDLTQAIYLAQMLGIEIE